MKVITLPCPNASNYDPSNRYGHYLAACRAVDDLYGKISREEQRNLLDLLSKVRTEAFCHGNSPDEPF